MNQRKENSEGMGSKCTQFYIYEFIHLASEETTILFINFYFYLFILLFNQISDFTITKTMKSINHLI